MGGTTANSMVCPQFRPEQLNLSTGTPVGSGAISQVVQSTLTGKAYNNLHIVVKIVSKLQALQQNKVESVMSEKSALLKLAPHPFIARLYGTSQSEDELYFVMEALPNGDLLQHIRRTASGRVRAYTHLHRGDTTPAAALTPVGVSKASGKSGHEEGLRMIPTSSTALRCMDFHDIQLITAQLVLGMARVFDRGLVLRDLKPENIVFDSKYRACLIDFDTVDLDGANHRPRTNHGLAVPPEREDAAEEDGAQQRGATPVRRITISEIQSMRKRTASFCGTAQYVSPEMVGECCWSFSSDLWALGATVYEMLYGVHMFSGAGAFEVIRKVVQGVSGTSTTPFPRVDLTEASSTAAVREAGDEFDRLKDFILSLVVIDPYRRLGVHPVTHTFDLDALKQHAFFRNFDWSVLETHIGLFKPRVFPLETDGVMKASEVMAGDPDLSPSLQALYHSLPENDPQYAEYVYRATADANPFERFMKHILLTPDSAEDREDLDSSPADDGSAVVAAPVASQYQRPTSGCVDHSGDDDDSVDSVEVVDDVGIRYAGNPADKDFQH